MSWSVDLLIVSEKPLRAIAEDIGVITSLPLNKMDGDEEAYILGKLEAQLVIAQNYLVNDDDLLLENYDVIISIWSTRLPEWEASEEECRKIGVKLFGELKALYHTSLMLTENGQKQLLIFDPTL